MKGSALALVDADRIHDYVFSPHQLKLIRGGSNLQSQTNERDILSLVIAQYGDGNVTGSLDIVDTPTLETNPQQRWEVVFAGGGTFLIHFRDPDDAVNFCHNAAGLYDKSTRCASASWAVAPWQVDFPTTLDQVQRSLETNKLARSETVFNGSAPYWKVCESCGGYPAAGDVIEADGSPRAVCAACANRRNNSKKAPYLADILGANGQPPDSFADLAAISRPANYLAMVYLDFDRMGRYLYRRAGPRKEEYRRASREVKETVKNGVMQGCKAVNEQIQPGYAPFEILILGGDDAIVMLPAQGVFEFLDSFTKRCESAFKDKEPWFSAGVMWAHSQYPIAQFRKRAEELMRSAKRRQNVHSVDYLIATEAMVKDLRDVRQEASRDGLQRTLKPYSVKQFLNLVNRIKEWKQLGVPSSKVQALYRIAYQGWDQSCLDYDYLFSRLSKPHQKSFGEVFPHPDGIWEPAPQRRTQAADLAELWDFVEA